MKTNTTTIDDTKTLVDDLNSWSYIIYAATIDSTIPTLSAQRPVKLAAHSQQYFNAVSTSYNINGITLLLTVNDVTLSTLDICQPVKRCVKTIVSQSEARYNIEIENCSSTINLLAINI